MNTLKAEKRSMDIKAKKLRREGYVVGNVFGKKIEGSIPVKFHTLELEKFLKKAHKGSQIMLDVEGTQYDAPVSYTHLSSGFTFLQLEKAYAESSA